MDPIARIAPAIPPAPGPPRPPVPDAPPAPAEPRIARANPSVTFDAALGLLVLEFRDGAGEVTRSIPTERELLAYRIAHLRGEPLPGAPSDRQTLNPMAGDAAANPGSPAG